MWIGHQTFAAGQLRETEEEEAAGERRGEGGGEAVYLEEAAAAALAGAQETFRFGYFLIYLINIKWARRWMKRQWSGEKRRKKKKFQSL